MIKVQRISDCGKQFPIYLFTNISHNRLLEKIQKIPIDKCSVTNMPNKSFPKKNQQQFI